MHLKEYKVGKRFSTRHWAVVAFVFCQSLSAFSFEAQHEYDQPRWDVLPYLFWMEFYKSSNCIQILSKLQVQYKRIRIRIGNLFFL